MDDGDDGGHGVCLDSLLGFVKVNFDCAARTGSILEILTSIQLGLDPVDGPDGDILQLDNLSRGMLRTVQRSHCNALHLYVCPLACKKYLQKLPQLLDFHEKKAEV